MDDDLTIVELIKERTSWRSYDNLGMDQQTEKDLREFISKPGEPPFGAKTSFHLIEAQAPERGSVPGTYGVIKGANRFIVGAVQEGENDLEDYGYLFEKIILFATGLGLGTCWMGWFNEKAVKRLLGLPRKTKIDIVISLGYPADDRVREKKREPLERIRRYFDPNGGSQEVAKVREGETTI